MRTNIEIDDELITQAMASGGYPTKRATVEAGLRMLTQRRRAYAGLLALGGKINWQGDLDAQRRDGPPTDSSASRLRVQEEPATYKLGKAKPAARTGVKTRSTRAPRKAAR